MVGFTEVERGWMDQMLMNLGYADTSRIFRRLPRLDFDTVCETI